MGKMVGWKKASPPATRPLRNAAEEECRRRIEADGLHPTKRGWPDFLAFDKDGELRYVVEVKKTAGQRLKASQVAVMSILKRAGIRVLRFDPDNGFTEFHTDQERRDAAFQNGCLLTVPKSTCRVGLADRNR